MYIKINSEEFLGVAELKKLQRSFTEDGMIRNLLANTKTFGLVKNAILNGTLIEAKDVFNVTKAGSPLGDIIINPGSAIDKNGLLALSNDTIQRSVLANSQFYWVKIKHLYSPLEVGTVSIDVDGNLSGIGTKFTEVFRGQPDFPSKITFPNAVTNVFSYEVVKVINDTTAIIAGDFAAETLLNYTIYGTFTPGYPVPSGQENILQYDLVQVDLVPETILNTPPAKTIDEEFYVARVMFDGVTLTVEDKRSEFWQTHSDYDIRFVDRTLVNNVFGVEKILWDVESTPKNTNEVNIAWSFRSSSYTIDTSSKKITINAGQGGRFKDSSYFANGQFDSWRIYSKNGTWKTIVSSTKTGSQINLTLDNLEPDDYVGFTEIVITPPYEAIQIRSRWDAATPADISKQLEMIYDFPINETIGKIYLRCPHDLYKYNLVFRYKTFEDYTDWQTPLSDAVGFYTEKAFDQFGDLLPIVISNTILANQTAGYLKAYVSDANNGYIELFENANSYNTFSTRVDTGDLFGVAESVLSNASFTPAVQLYVGTDRQYQHFLGGAFTLSTAGVINLNVTKLDTTALRNGNSFILHINQSVTSGGFTFRIYQDFFGTPIVVMELTTNDFLYLQDTVGNPKGMTIKCTWDGTKWIADKVNETIVAYQKVNEVIRSDGNQALVNTSFAQYPSLTYTTPNDGITRKLKLEFKLTYVTSTYTIDTGGYEYELRVDGVAVDTAKLSYTTNVTAFAADGTISMIDIRDVPANKVIEVQVKFAGTVSAITQQARLVITELK